MVGHSAHGCGGLFGGVAMNCIFSDTSAAAPAAADASPTVPSDAFIIDQATSFIVRQPSPRSFAPLSASVSSWRSWCTICPVASSMRPVW
ncbi:MAG TPA: hypothetical protein VIL94_03160, partial [Acidothermaceae bacterium]